MPAYVVQIDTISPVALVEDGDLSRTHDMSHCTVQMKGGEAGKYQAVEHAGAFNEGDMAIFIAHGSVVPLNPLTQKWVSRIVQSQQVTTASGDVWRDGHLIPMYLARQFFRVAIGDGPTDCPPPGTNIAAVMGITEEDLRSDEEKHAQSILDEIGEAMRVTVFEKPRELLIHATLSLPATGSMPVAAETFFDKYPEHKLCVWTNETRTQIVVEGVMKDETMLPWTEMQTMCHCMGMEYVKPLWDAPLGTYQRTYQGFMEFFDEVSHTYIVRENITPPRCWEVPPRVSRDALPAALG
jgi:hypothetical protein